MTRLQITSIDEPMASDSRAALAAARLVTRADFLGLLDDIGGDVVLDHNLLLAVLAKLSDAGVGRENRLLLSRARLGEDYRRILESVLEETEHSPLPDHEWQPLLAALDDATLAALVGISPASVRRYSRRERPTPDDVAARLHFLALVVADLSGAYNSFGIRRWFDRARQALGGRSPRALLGAGFDPDGPDAAALRQLAADLVGGGAS